MAGDRSQSREKRTLGAEAGAWFVRMRSDERTPDDERRFRDWQAAAPEHRTAYAGLQRSIDGLDVFAGAPEILAMREAALRRPNPVFRLAGRAPRRAAAAALAACLLLAVFAFPGGPLWTGAQQSGVYETGRGERSTVHLSDGTLATLTTDSVLIEEFTPEMRRVRLVKGQVYFDVMSDAGRPFVVEAGDGTVMALGTQFDMCRKTGRVVVTLIEGAIEVASRETQHTEEKSVTLKTGEQVSYDAGKLSEVQEVDVASVSSWRNGMIRAEEGDSFASFVERFNRHSGYKVLIDGQDPRFREIPIDGTFSVDNPEAVAATLKDADYLKKRGLMAHTVKDSAGNLRVNLYSRSFRSED